MKLMEILTDGHFILSMIFLVSLISCFILLWYTQNLIFVVIGMPLGGFAVGVCE